RFLTETEYLVALILARDRDHNHSSHLTREAGAVSLREIVELAADLSDDKIADPDLVRTHAVQMSTMADDRVTGRATARCTGIGRDPPERNILDRCHSPDRDELSAHRIPDQIAWKQRSRTPRTELSFYKIGDLDAVIDRMIIAGGSRRCLVKIISMFHSTKSMRVSEAVTTGFGFKVMITKGRGPDIAACLRILKNVLTKRVKRRASYDPARRQRVMQNIEGNLPIVDIRLLNASAEHFDPLAGGKICSSLVEPSDDRNSRSPFEPVRCDVLTDDPIFILEFHADAIGCGIERLPDLPDIFKSVQIHIAADSERRRCVPKNAGIRKRQFDGVVDLTRTRKDRHKIWRDGSAHFIKLFTSA